MDEVHNTDIRHACVCTDDLVAYIRIEERTLWFGLAVLLQYYWPWQRGGGPDPPHW